MSLFSKSALRRVGAYAVLPMIVGGLLLICVKIVDSSPPMPGIFTGGALVGLGACVRCLEDWEKERGLWLLATIFLVMILPIYLGGFYGTVLEPLKTGGGPWGQALDASLATMVTWQMVRFLVSVIVYNRKLSARSLEPEDLTPTD